MITFLTALVNLFLALFVAWQKYRESEKQKEKRLEKYAQEVRKALADSDAELLSRHVDKLRTRYNHFKQQRSKKG